jgi:hypothetical protein
MAYPKLAFSVLEGRFAITRLSPRSSIPDWALDANFFSITRTREELSVVCPEDRVPEGERCDTGWRCLMIQGPLDFSMIGVMASLSMPLAEAGIPMFPISTFDTDYLLIKGEDFERGILALAGAGHSVRRRQ